MKLTYRNSLKLVAITTAVAALSACSTTPLTCDHALPTKADLAQSSTKTQTQQSQPAAQSLPAGNNTNALTLVANNASVTDDSSHHYTLQVNTSAVNDVLAIQSAQQNHASTSFSGQSLQAFWPQASSYFNNQYQYAVITAHNLPSHIIEVDSSYYTPTTITYHVTSSEPLSSGDLQHVILTLDK